MSEFRKIANPLTGAPQFVGGAVLTQAPTDTWIEYTKTSTGETKRYKLVNTTVEIGGKVMPLVCTLPEKNDALMTKQGGKFTVGTSYLTTIEMVKSNKPEDNGRLKPFGRISHLTGVPTDEVGITNALMDAFGGESAFATMDIPVAKTAPVAPVEELKN